MKQTGNKTRSAAIVHRRRVNSNPTGGVSADDLSAKATRFLGSAPVIEAINRRLRGDQPDLSSLSHEDMVAYVRWLASKQSTGS